MTDTTKPSLATGRAVYAQLLAFLRQPAVLSPSGLRRRKDWQSLGWLYLLHVGVLLLIVLPITSAIQSTLKLAQPDAFDKLPGGWLLPVTVIVAPLLEELIFRGWQSGRPRALWLLACGTLAGITLMASARGLNPLWSAGLLLPLLLGAVIGWVLLRKRPTPRVFRRAFPAIYWCVAAIFAATHLLNYGSPTALTLLLVLPQLWAGIMLGYTRQRLGLGASMLEHASANAVVMALALLPGL